MNNCDRVMYDNSFSPEDSH